MMTVESILMPPTVDEHFLVVRHTQQLRELEQKLEAAAADHAALVAERQQLRTARHNGEVARLLTPGMGASDDITARLTQVDVEIERASETEHIHRDALNMLQTAAAVSRKQAQADVRQQVEEAAQAVVRQMVPLAQQLRVLNEQLFALATREPGLPVPAIQLLMMWLQQAAAVGA